jgi:integrase/recombinase XerD
METAPSRWQTGEGTPHILRDTFAVELLLSGVPMEDVQILLGHTSIRTTEKNYAPWVKAR